MDAQRRHTNTPKNSGRRRSVAPERRPSRPRVPLSSFRKSSRILGTPTGRPKRSFIAKSSYALNGHRTLLPPNTSL